MSNPTALVQKLWNYCNILRDDGLSYGDYVEQLTFLLFLKMADEQAWPPFNKLSPIPKGKDWPALLAKDGDKLVMLVEKMLALTPKLRAAKTEAEKATLQNAVSKTDQDIDALVYELYAITPDEIALVESSGARKPAEGCPEGGRGGARQRGK